MSLADQEVCEAQCGNYGNLLSHLFVKNFVKTTHLLNELLIFDLTRKYFIKSTLGISLHM